MEYITWNTLHGMHYMEYITWNTLHGIYYRSWKNYIQIDIKSLKRENVTLKFEVMYLTAGPVSGPS